MGKHDVCDMCKRVRMHSGNNTQHTVVLFAVRVMCERLVADRDYYYGVRALSLKVPVAGGQRMRRKRMRSLTTNAKWAPREASPRHGRLFRLLAKRYYLAEGGQSLLNLKAHYILNEALVDVFGPDVKSLPERMAAVYRAVWAGDRTTNRALFAALPSDTLRLVDANGTWTNIATVGPACLRTGFATDCPCIDVLVEADSAQPRVPMGGVPGGCTACGTAATASCRTCAGAPSFL